MISRQQSRRVISMAIMPALLLWTQLGVAGMPASGYGPQCHSRNGGMHPAAQMMPAGCCPRHAGNTHKCPSHRKLAIVPPDHPGCCAISNRPSQPIAFVATSRHLAPSGIQTSTIPDPATDLAVRAIRPADSPPFVQSVFDKKADLRI